MERRERERGGESAEAGVPPNCDAPDLNNHAQRGNVPTARPIKKGSLIFFFYFLEM